MSSDFSEDDGYLRADDSSCVSPSGKVEVKDGLIIASFVLANVVQGLWFACLVTFRRAATTDCNG